MLLRYKIEIKAVLKTIKSEAHLGGGIGLGLLLGTQLVAVHAEELGRLGGLLARDIVEGRGGHIVCLALADQAVVLKEVLLLGVVDVGLGLEDSLGLAPVLSLLLAVT